MTIFSMNNLASEIWNRRSLILLLALNDLKLRYRNSVLGFFWTFLEPLLLLSVLYFVFSNIFRGSIEHYPLFILMGLILWNTFSRGTSMAMESIILKANLVSQTYLPREVPVISAVLTSFMMTIFEFAVFFLFMGIFRIIPTVTIIVLPLGLLILFILTLGISFGLASLNVYYRDLKSIWQVILQAGFFLTPIFYSMDLVPQNIKTIISSSPFAYLLDLTRSATIYNEWPSGNGIAYLLILVSVISIISYIIFKKLDKRIIEEL